MISTIFTSLLLLSVYFHSFNCINRPHVRKYFASTVKGLEKVLYQEVSQIPNAFDIKLANCGVEYSGDDEVGFRSLMWLRTSLKVMELIKYSTGVTDKTTLYKFCKTINWLDIIDSSNTIKCDTVLGRTSQDLSHSHYTSLTVKNAIIDQIRDNIGSRPDIDIEDPDYCFHLYLDREKASLYRLWSGNLSMHKRGYRETVHKAALRETTAAALILMSKWKYGEQTLCDPMCGSGTIPIEAALIAANTAPGLLRYSNISKPSYESPKPYHWKGISQEAWNHVLNEAFQVDRRQEYHHMKATPMIMANDKHASAVKLAVNSSVHAGVRHMIHFSCDDVLDYRPMQPVGMAICNPPWNIRLEGANEAWDVLRLFSVANVPTHKLWTLTGDQMLLHRMKRRPIQEIKFQAANTDLAYALY